MSEIPNRSAAGTPADRNAGVVAQIIVSWMLVGVPLAYGIFQTVNKASALFG